MSDKMRWRYGETNPVMAPVSIAQIEIGDLLYWEDNVAKPASGHVTTGAIGTVQNNFAARFLGVAMQRSGAGETLPIRVATTGIFEFESNPATYEIGGLVTVVMATGATTLDNQKVGATMSALSAIARVARREPVAAASVLVSISSTVMQGGVRGTTHGAT